MFELPNVRPPVPQQRTFRNSKNWISFEMYKKEMIYFHNSITPSIPIQRSPVLISCVETTENSMFDILTSFFPDE